MDPKKEVLYRVYIVFGCLCLFGVIILGRVFFLQFVEGAKWRKMAQTLTTAYKNIEPSRGNIYADDGSLLGTSIPIYELRMDVNAVSDKVFKDDLDSLAMGLSDVFKDHSWKTYRGNLSRARKRREQYLLIHRGVSYNQLKQVRKLPIYRMGRYKGGLIIIEKNHRAKPFEKLASRTIGFYQEGQKPVGLEGAYTDYLQGTGGKRLMRKISGGIWMPINDDNEVEPQDGSDLWTSIDINIQDVAESALMTALSKNAADHGCAVLMEVATGEIKAIANLTRDSSGEYFESYNYALGESMEPGSTFKLVSMVAAMEDGKVKPSDYVDIEHGVKKYSDRVMKDSHEEIPNRMTVQHAFEISSNVGISKIIYNAYQTHQADFVKAVRRMSVGQALNMDIPGEASPLIKNPKDSKTWSAVSLPWMSIGYEVRMTPLQMLTFYNAIANNGKMVKPVFVKSITHRGKQVQHFEPTVINPKICSATTIKYAQGLLQGVVENGTATNLKNPNYKIAGKTGTAQIANRENGYKNKSAVTYQASFAGYFPADNPKYSCIVVVNAPSKLDYYAAVVAGPVFKEIADKVYSSRLDMHREYFGESAVNLAQQAKKQNTSLAWMIGNAEDIRTVSQKIGMKTNEIGSAEWVQLNLKNNQASVSTMRQGKGVPNVQGMGLRDAVYLLEMSGLTVKAVGRGFVKKQSLSPGVAIEKGASIQIDLL